MYARKNNQIIRITEVEENKYLNKGFDIYNDDKTIKKKAVPTDINVLRFEYCRLVKENEELKKKLSLHTIEDEPKMEAPINETLSPVEEDEVIREAKRRGLKKTK